MIFWFLSKLPLPATLLGILFVYLQTTPACCQDKNDATQRASSRVLSKDDVFEEVRGEVGDSASIIWKKIFERLNSPKSITARLQMKEYPYSEKTLLLESTEDAKLFQRYFLVDLWIDPSDFSTRQDWVTLKSETNDGPIERVREFPSLFSGVAWTEKRFVDSIEMYLETPEYQVRRFPTQRIKAIVPPTPKEYTGTIDIRCLGWFHYGELKRGFRLDFLQRIHETFEPFSLNIDQGKFKLVRYSKRRGDAVVVVGDLASGRLERISIHETFEKMSPESIICIKVPWVEGIFQYRDDALSRVICTGTPNTLSKKGTLWDIRFLHYSEDNPSILKQFDVGTFLGPTEKIEIDPSLIEEYPETFARFSGK